MRAAAGAVALAVAGAVALAVAGAVAGAGAGAVALAVSTTAAVALAGSVRLAGLGLRAGWVWVCVPVWGWVCVPAWVWVCVPVWLVCVPLSGLRAGLRLGLPADASPVAVPRTVAVTRLVAGGGPVVGRAVTVAVADLVRDAVARRVQSRCARLRRDRGAVAVL